VQLIGFITRIYHDARSSKCQTMSNLITGIFWLSTTVLSTHYQQNAYCIPKW